MIAWIRSGDKRGTGEVIMMTAGKFKVAAPGFGGVLRGLLKELDEGVKDHVDLLCK
jgi:hypothetical protein